MSYNQDLTAPRLAEWVDTLEHFDLPEWDRLPQLDLYMDQVIILLTQYLGPLVRDDEKAITASIINNYVRMKVMPPPVKKKYSRVHIACLVIICILKQSLSISCIQRMLPEDHSEEAVQALYDDFVQQYRSVSAAFIRHIQSPGNSMLPDTGGNLVTSTAVLSTLAKALTEYLLKNDTEEEE